MIEKIKNKQLILIAFLASWAFFTTFALTYGSFKSDVLINTVEKGIVGDTVYVNDLKSDYYYFTGLNYTESEDGKLPSLEDKNKYNDNNLVKVTLNYSGKDYNSNQTGYVSIDEMQNKFVYYKYYVVENGYVDITLIDNPFTNHPNNKVFNGWVVDNENAEIILDKTYYERHLKMPVTFSNGIPNEITLNIYASWTSGAISTVNSQTTFDTAFSELKAVGMNEINYKTDVYEDPKVEGYYTKETITTVTTASSSGGWWGDAQTSTEYAKCTDCYDSEGTYHEEYTCPAPNVSWPRPGSTYRNNCDVYYLQKNTDIFDETKEYYKFENNTFTVVSLSKVFVGTEVSSDFGENGNMAGYYRKVTIPTNGSINGYYDNEGNLQSGTCSSTSCSLYELIQFKDGAIDTSERYYYLTTRDTNVLVMTENVSQSWSSTNNKPFTLTSINNGTNYNAVWNVSNSAVICYNDTRIENITISSQTGTANSNPTINTNSSRVFYGNHFNAKLGRGIKRSGNYVNFVSVLGGMNVQSNYWSSSSTVGSASAPKKSKLEIESGYYNSTSLTFGATTGTNSTILYTETIGVYGNDYDRVTEDNGSLDIYYCASGSWSGRVHSSNDTLVPALYTIVKSGSFGTGKYDLTTGIYVGARYGGTHYAPRSAKIEGGYIYNLNGGPITASTKTDTNDTYIYMTGGEVDMIVGGAGTTATYGNRITQVTGGRVNYGVAGGSNGYDGSSSDGTINGSTYVYIGGTALIGNDDYINSQNTLWGVEPGSVFGAGNGNTSSTSIGSVDDSNIVINDEAVIKANVYGSGNYGTVGYNSKSNTTKTNIKILGGTVYGSVFGSGNNSGSGKSSIQSNTNVEMYGGAVLNSVHGGSNQKGTLYGSSNVKIFGGNVKDVYGGGLGEDTYVTGNVDVQISNVNSLNISGSVYGGSAYGVVNSSSKNETKTNYTTLVTVNGGKVNNVFGGGKGSETQIPYVAGDVTVTINGGEITNVYGGNDANSEPNGDVKVYINSGTITNVYGGGNNTLVSNTNVYQNGGIVTNLFGGSNQKGDVKTSNVTINQGKTTNVYGGNNIGGNVSESNVVVNNGLLENVFGGGYSAPVTTSNLTVNSGMITSAYGGGNKAGVTDTNVSLLGGNVTNVYGGSNESGDVSESNVVTKEKTNSNEPVKMEISYTKKAAESWQSQTHKTYASVTVTLTNNTSSPINNYKANIYSKGAKVFSNYSGTKLVENDGYLSFDEKNIYYGINSIPASGTYTFNFEMLSLSEVDDFDLSYGATFENGNYQSNFSSDILVSNLYGGNNMGGVTNTSNVILNTGKITNAYGGGNKAETSNTNITLKGGTLKNVYGGGNEAGATKTNITLKGGTSDYVFGGSNNSGDVSESFINALNPASLNVENLYGGNNMGGITGETNIDLTGGVYKNIYGGGNMTSANETNVNVNNITMSGEFFGGGNKAEINNNTNVIIKNSNIDGDIFGGGNLGGVSKDTNVSVSNSHIKSSCFAGGNGQSAVVLGSTHLNIDDNSIIEKHVFGGGNAANTGLENVDSSESIINIAGATINGNVYGGANTATLYGTVELNIGENVITENLKPSDIYIKGTVFGGGNAAKLEDGAISGDDGDASEGGSEKYDWKFISVTTGITMNIDAKNYTNFKILGSIFGSGNASNTSGYSYVNIDNYGTFDDYKENVSIQRTKKLTIKNSAIKLKGAKDNTNEFNNYYFSLSRIDELVLANNSTLFLENGANLLQKFSSLKISGEEEEKASVVINEDGTIERNVNNRIYMLSKEDNPLNIATNESATTYGDVDGMTFFGLFSLDRNKKVITALYDDKYKDSGVIPSGDLYAFQVGSYVMGKHKENHDITKDGFYSNFANDDESDKMDVKYIVPTPPAGVSYMWSIGEQVESYSVTLSASKFSTLGMKEVPIIFTTSPNTRFDVLGFNTLNADSSLELVNQNEIKKINTEGTANTKMALVMEGSENSFITDGQTNFYTDENHAYSGTTSYKKDNTETNPTFNFSLYHSKNITEEKEFGTVVVSLQAVVPTTELANEVKRININITIVSELSNKNEYEAVMAPGEKHEIFPQAQTNITTKSKFSTYFALYMENEEKYYKEGYNHALASSYVLPLNTKITMIDLASDDTPKYYYRVINETDVINATTELNNQGECSYHLKDFIQMGSTSSDNVYNEKDNQLKYYNDELKITEEEFIFIIDFGSTNISTDILSNSLLFELRNENDQTLISVLGQQHANMVYNLYNKSNAKIEIDGSLNKTDIYLGDTFNLSLTTNFVGPTYNGLSITDTTYYDKKLGIKITILDSEGNVLNNSSILGINYSFDDVLYYPRMDGTVRMSIADRVANVFTRIFVNTKNANLSSGNYMLKIESFGSNDGIYYGSTSSDEITLPFKIVNSRYGLKTTLNDSSAIISAQTGLNPGGNNALVFNVIYSSNLENPNLRLSLYRRKYDEIYDKNYEKVDLKDYITNNLTDKGKNEYLLESNPLSQMTKFIYMKNNLKSGTYKFVFSLYDGDVYIGDTENYVIIK